MNRLRHAIVGCGRVAPNHAFAFQAIPDCEVTIVCDREISKATELACQYAIPRAVADAREVFSDPTIDSVSIAVDHAAHGRLVLQALKAGKHVLVEKPIALDPQEAEQAISISEQAGLVLSPVSQHRFDPVVRSVQRAIEAGALGRLSAIWTSLVCGRDPDYYRTSYWRGTWAGEGGSLLMNQAYHAVDLMHLLAGPSRPGASAMSNAYLGSVIETEDTVAAIVSFENGCIGTVSSTSAAKDFWHSSITVVGTRGTVEFDIGHPTKLRHCSLVDSRTEEHIRAACLAPSRPPPGVSYYGASHVDQAADFLSAIRDGRRPAVTARDGLLTLELIRSLYRIARWY
ncbi:Gfo/Idh/MocA family protein [Bradyrhizobium lablabi]|uniref:Gfo/Idh/MocA family protein n=1 Tax=Bradyrhizobium lablabi TaxID=722472 RepID=UPI001BAACD33|nr:Gfo/Idh/MocA family oxidoreductase [Bradyrhizobium lablabi]MBR0696585.1 Gfo/Idh/MocA family oxidoreductase [Bradyrhizobium lablabi]